MNYETTQNKIGTEVVVSLLAFYSNDMSSNPGESDIYIVLLKIESKQ